MSAIPFTVRAGGLLAAQPPLCRDFSRCAWANAIARRWLTLGEGK